MSILVLDNKVYEQVLNRMLYYGHQSEVGINYCKYLKSFADKKLVEDYEIMCQELVQHWSNLVIKSHHYKYTPTETLLPIYFEKVNINRKSMSINTYQFLKFLICIKYQIEITTIQTDRITLDETGAYAMLRQLIDSVQYSVIESLPEYKIQKS